MKKIAYIIVALLGVQFAHAQLVDPALLCEDATIMCSMDDELNGFMSTMPDSNDDDVPNPLCPGGGQPHNLSWFAFVAGSTDVTLELTASDCTGGGFFGIGIQYGVYTDCTFDESVVCDPGCNDEVFEIVMDNLVLGDTYYIFLDGCAGTVCEYTIAVLEGGQFNELDEPTGIGCDDCTELSPGVFEICEGADNVEFEVLGFDLSIEYTWDLSGTATENHVNLGPNTQDFDFDKFIEQGIPRLNYEYVATVFKIKSSRWKDFFSEFFQWIVTTFQDQHADLPTFVFFFVVYIENAHEPNELPEDAKKIIQSIDQIAKSNSNTTLIENLKPVKIDDVETWFNDLGEENPDKILDLVNSMVLGLDEEKQRIYKESEKLDMSTIELLQELVYKIVNK